MSYDCVVEDKCRDFVKDFDTFVEIWNDCSNFRDATLAGIEFNDEHDSCIVRLRPISLLLNSYEFTLFSLIFLISEVHSFILFLSM